MTSAAAQGDCPQVAHRYHPDFTGETMECHDATCRCKQSASCVWWSFINNTRKEIKVMVEIPIALLVIPVESIAFSPPFYNTRAERESGILLDSSTRRTGGDMWACMYLDEPIAVHSCESVDIDGWRVQYHSCNQRARSTNHKMNNKKPSMSPPNVHPHALSLRGYVSTPNTGVTRKSVPSGDNTFAAPRGPWKTFFTCGGGVKRTAHVPRTMRRVIRSPDGPPTW